MATKEKGYTRLSHRVKIWPFFDVSWTSPILDSSGSFVRTEKASLWCNAGACKTAKLFTGDPEVSLDTSRGLSYVGALLSPGDLQPAPDMRRQAPFRSIKERMYRNIVGLLSSTVSITRYRVEGKLKAPILATVASCLKENVIPQIDGDVSDKTVGWTSFDTPFAPNFEGSSFVIGAYLVFSLRIDKRIIPSKVVKKHCAIEAAKRLAESGRPYLSREEKNMILDHVQNVLALRIPATPYLYDLIWSYEDASLWFFSTQKSANEELETLFLRSFRLSLIRLFPYTSADLMMGLSDQQRDLLPKLSATNFSE